VSPSKGFGLVLATLLGLLIAQPASAQAADLPTVNYDVETGAFDGTLPHRSDFIVKVEVPRAYNRVTLKYWDAGGAGECKSAPTKAPTAWGVNREPLEDDVSVRVVNVKVPALEFSRSYCFAAELGREWGALDAAALAQGLKDVLDTLLSTGRLRKDEILAAVRTRIPDSQVLTTKEVGKAKPQMLDDYLTRWLMKQLGDNGVANLMSTADTDLRNVAQSRGRLALDLVAAELFAPPPAPPAAGAGAAAIAAAAAAAPPPNLPQLQTALQALRTASSSLTAAAFAVRELQANPTTFNDLRGAAQGFVDEVDRNPGFCAPVPVRWQKTCSTRVTAVNLVTLIDQATLSTRNLSAALAKQEVDDASIAGKLRTTASIGPASTLTSSPSYTERSIFYIAGDVGAVLPLFYTWGQKLGKVDADYALYAGVSFYFVPVDKDKPLSLEGGAWRRLSLNAGVTLNDVKDPAGSARGAIDGKGAMVGAGVRLTDYLRLSVGGMLIRQKHNNPLSTREVLRITPYASASVDVDVVGTVSGFFKKPGTPD